MLKLLASPIVLWIRAEGFKVQNNRKSNSTLAFALSSKPRKLL